MIHRSAPRIRPHAGLLLCACTLTLAGQVHAAGDSPWFVRVGPGAIVFDEDVTLRAGGGVVPGAGGHVKNNATLMAEFGYSFTRNWAAGLTIGVPPKTRLTGTGTVAALGEVGSVRYGPASLTLQYRFADVPSFTPYVGAGVAYNMIFREKDGAVRDLKVDSTWGTALQAGVEYPLSPTTGLFVDVKKIYLKTTAAGTLQGAPVEARVRLNPLVVQAGFYLRF